MRIVYVIYLCALASHPDYAFELIEAKTARQGIQQVFDQAADRVLLDDHLPDLNGLEFLRELGVDHAQGYAIMQPRPLAELHAVGTVRPPTDRSA